MDELSADVSVRRRSRWTAPRWLQAVTDQGVVAGVNLFMAIGIARAGGVDELGLYALISTTLLLFMTLNRMLVLDSWLASRLVGTAPTPELRWLTVVGSLVSAAGTTVVVLVSAPHQGIWLVAVVVAPMFIIQDAGRYAAFKREAPALALLTDGLILVAGLGAAGILLAVGRRGVDVVAISWLVGYAAGTLTSLGWTWGGLGVRRSLAWWTRYCRPLAAKLTQEGLAYVVGVSGSIYLLAALANRHEVGITRIAQTAYSPMALVITGSSMWLIPTMARRDGAGALRLRRKVTMLMTSASVPALILSALVGPWLIRLVFGVDNPPSRWTILLADISTALVAIYAPWAASARVAVRFAPIAWARTAGAVVIWAGLLAVSATRTANGYLILLALQNVIVTVTSIVVGRRLTMTEGTASSPEHG